MGANYQQAVLPGSLGRAEVREQFDNIRSKDRHDNGHSYSGGFGMADKAIFPPVPAFASVDAAEDWIQSNAQKWENALCVQATDARATQWNGTPNPDLGKLVWVIGAWCAS